MYISAQKFVMAEISIKDKEYFMKITPLYKDRFIFQNKR